LIYILILIIFIGALILTIQLWKNTKKKKLLSIYILIILIIIVSLVLGIVNGSAFHTPDIPKILPYKPIA